LRRLNSSFLTSAFFASLTLAVNQARAADSCIVQAISSLTDPMVSDAFENFVKLSEETDQSLLEKVKKGRDVQF